jgi:hypothetical protein
MAYKKSSTSLTTREIQIKTTLRFHFTAIRMAITKKTRNMDAGDAAQYYSTCLAPTKHKFWFPALSKKKKKKRERDVGVDVGKKETLEHCW